MAELSAIDFHFNKDGWGPTETPAQYASLPFAPYSKSDRCGRVADFTSSYGNNRRPTSSTTNDNFAYNANDNDDGGEAFKLVDTAQTKSASTWKGNNRRRFVRKNQPPAREEPKEQVRSHLQPQRSKRRNNWGKNSGRRWNQRIDRQSSVKIGAEWNVIEEFDLSSLNKLTYSTEAVTSRKNTVSEVPTSEDLLTCGFVDEVNDGFDRVTSKTATKLRVNSNREFYPVSTTDDPVIERFAVEDKGNVFATDAIMAHLMSASRSVYPWDIVVQKLPDGKIFFDKRDDSQFDFLTVSETSNDPPKSETFDEENEDNKKDNINTPERLSLEATTINQNFSQQILKGSAGGGPNGRKQFGNPNPFFDEEEADGMEPASTAFKYRKFAMGDVDLICRTELHGVIRKSGKGEQMCTTFALNEWDSKKSGGDRLEGQDRQPEGSRLGHGAQEQLVQAGQVDRAESAERGGHHEAGVRQQGQGGERVRARHLGLPERQAGGVCQAAVLGREQFVRSDQVLCRHL